MAIGNEQTEGNVLCLLALVSLSLSGHRGRFEGCIVVVGDDVVDVVDVAPWSLRALEIHRIVVVIAIGIMTIIIVVPSLSS